MQTTTGVIRRGLPRYPGGDPWPPANALPQGESSAATFEDSTAPTQTQPSPIEPAHTEATEPQAPDTPAPAATSHDAFARDDVRQGLPRVVGGDPWPPVSAVVEAPTATSPVTDSTPAPVQSQPSAPSNSAVPAATKPTSPTRMQPSSPAPQPTTSASTSRAEPKKLGPLTVKQWIPVTVVGTFAVFGMATALVLGARWLLGLDAVAQFVATYPGEYDLPENAPVGFPAWMGWQHFFNVFLMVLIIRTGLQVRHQQKPPAYWSSKRSPKVSINLWLHQSLDVLWLVNGLVFVVLLIVTGHWMRIVPTSWEVFPNALSAALQYMSLDWPTDNGWVNYNALQELAYFVTVFIAAPLAAVTGYRMSAFWPKKADTLNRLYPVELARKLHFPVMIYFVVFIFTHVALVFSTGALRNLNHMYAAQGSTDPTLYAENWTGFWMFAASLLVIAPAWVACRPMILAPIARLFGTVSKR